MFKSVIGFLFTTFAISAAVAGVVAWQHDSADKRQALSNELDQATSQRFAAEKAVAIREGQIQSIRQDLDGVHNQQAQFTAQVGDYLKAHQMAVAALVAEGAGGEVLSDDNHFSEDAKEVAGAAVIAATGWCLFNINECMQVATDLNKADQDYKQLQNRETDLAASLNQQQDLLRQDRVGLQSVVAHVDQVRVELARL